MLDLNKLEQKLDKALEEETNESLTKWISIQRLKSYLNNSITEPETIFKAKFSFDYDYYFHNKFVNYNPNKIINSEQKVVKPNQGYDLAA